MAKLLNKTQKLKLLDEIHNLRERKRNTKLTKEEWTTIAQTVDLQDGSAAKACYYSLRDTYRKIKKNLDENPEHPIKWPYFDKIALLEGVDTLNIVRVVAPPAISITVRAANPHHIPQNVYKMMELVKKNPLIWNKTTRSPSETRRERRNKKELFWERVAMECEFANHYSAKATYQQLRDLYFRSLKSRRGIVGSKYFDLFKRMEFLGGDRPLLEPQPQQPPAPPQPPRPQRVRDPIQVAIAAAGAESRRAAARAHNALYAVANREE